MPKNIKQNARDNATQIGDVQGNVNIHNATDSKDGGNEAFNKWSEILGGIGAILGAIIGGFASLTNGDFWNFLVGVVLGFFFGGAIGYMLSVAIPIAILIGILYVVFLICTFFR